jgi:flagellar biosynthesis/type III secretory pathway chaperone
MTLNTPSPELAEVLSAEHAALLQGDFATLDRLIQRKEHCLTLLLADPPPPDKLARLQRQSARNQALLDGALAGLGMARAALAALASPRFTTTYGPDGQRESLQDQSQNLSRKF